METAKGRLEKGDQFPEKPSFAFAIASVDSVSANANANCAKCNELDPEALELIHNTHP
jgi:hypothetical protein